MACGRTDVPYFYGKLLQNLKLKFHYSAATVTVTGIVCRYNEGHDILDICSYLDPRVKATPYLTASQRAKVHDAIFAKLSAHTDISTAANASSRAAAETDVNITSKHRSALSDLLGDSYASGCSSSQSGHEETITFEVQRYFSEPSCAMTDSPLHW